MNCCQKYCKSTRECYNSKRRKCVEYNRGTFVKERFVIINVGSKTRIVDLATDSKLKPIFESQEEAKDYIADICKYKCIDFEKNC